MYTLPIRPRPPAAGLVALGPALIPALALVLALAGTGRAATQKNTSPIKIQADNADLSQQNNTSTYTGDVRLTRGAMTLTGSKLVINRIDDRNNLKAVLTGAPARLNKQPDASDRYVVTGHARSIEYTNTDATLILRGSAVVNRGGDEVRGELITHNLDTERTQAERGSSSDNRVHITIQPGGPAASGK